MKQLQNLDEIDLVFYDIETARGVEKLEEGTQLHDAWKYKARYQNELNKKTGEVFSVEEYYYEKAPLYAPFGRVVSIVVGRIKDNKVFLKPYSSYDEKELLEEFNKDLSTVYSNNPRMKMVGFNSNGFDAPYLLKRSLVNGVKPAPPLDEGTSKPWELQSIDLSKVWQGTAFYPDSLISVATAFGLPSPKDALDGSQVSDAFYEKRLDDIQTYCLKDVDTTIRVYRKLAMLPDLEEGFEIMGGKVGGKEMSLLEKLYASKEITESISKELKSLCAKKKLTKKDKENLKKILLGVMISDDFVNGQQDTKAVKADKEAQVDEFINTL